MGTEGRGIYHVDNKGYVNLSAPLEENGIIVVGASHTQGKEVKFGKRYTDILNKRLAVSEKTLKVYNVSQDGYFFPDIVKGFKCITGEFPKAGTIIIEIGATEFDEAALADAAAQRIYNENENGENIVQGLSVKKYLTLKVKEISPLLSLLKQQYKSIYSNDKNDKTVSDEMDLDYYKNILDKDLRLIRSEYAGNLIIMYHPVVELDKKGNLIADSSVTDKLFADLCKKNNIIFADVTAAFIKAYNNDYSVPYGFNNTSMCSGHLNETGHKIIADELYDILKGGVYK